MDGSPTNTRRRCAVHNLAMNAQKERSKLTRSRGVPTIDIDGTVLTGFNEQHVRGTLRRAAERRLQ